MDTTHMPSVSTLSTTITLYWLIKPLASDTFFMNRAQRRSMVIMNPAAVRTKRLLLLPVFVLASSLLVVDMLSMASAFSIPPPPPLQVIDVTSSRHSLSAKQCKVQDQADVQGKNGSSSCRSRSTIDRPPAVAILPLLLSFMIAVSPALASSSDRSSSAKIFNNVYADPLHPFCERQIQVSKDGTTFHYSGTAVGGLVDDNDHSKEGVLRRGCSPAEIKQYTLRRDALDGVVLDGGKRRISLAGDSSSRIHEGVWEAKGVADTNLGYEDVDGIRWNDGNKWIVESQSMIKKNAEGKNEVIKKPLSTVIGEFVIFAYISFSGLAGVKGIVDAYQRRQQQEQ
jgi:hypothetical protein